jgi:MOSC domain-containing protein YiiM
VATATVTAVSRDERHAFTRAGRLVRRAGVMAIVLAGGEVRAGDVIRVELLPPPRATLDRV